MYLEENDRGPDDAVHDWIGVAAASWDPGVPQGEVLDIKEVLYKLLNVESRGGEERSRHGGTR
ncbi:hypothetical protein D1872_301170 [compost metagenome]